MAFNMHNREILRHMLVTSPSYMTWDYGFGGSALQLIALSPSVKSNGGGQTRVITPVEFGTGEDNFLRFLEHNQGVLTCLSVNKLVLTCTDNGCQSVRFVDYWSACRINSKCLETSSKPISVTADCLGEPIPFNQQCQTQNGQQDMKLYS